MTRTNERISVESFIENLEVQIAEDKWPFIGNMNKLEMEDKTFCEWIQTFSAWMEWSKGDCEGYYG